MTINFSIGIDPGIKGAIAVCDGLNLVALYDMPIIESKQSSGKILKRVDIMQLMAIFQLYPTQLIVIEKVHARPGEGTVSSFNFGWNCGAIETCARLTGADVLMVTPQSWKKACGLNSDKDASRALATALSDDEVWFSRKKDDGRAEAYLLAQFGIEHYKGHDDE